MIYKNIRRNKMNKFLISCALACVVQGCMAQSRTLSLQECLDLALKQSYQMKAAEKSVERAKNLQGTAWDIDKTEVSLSQDPSSGGNTDNAMTVSQGIEFPTVYIARRKQLKAETQVEKSKLNLTKHDLACEVRSAYQQLVYENEILRLLNRQDSILDRYTTTASSKLKAGESRKLELLAAERMHRENELEIASTQSNIEASQLQLASLININENIIPADNVLTPLDFVQKDFNYQQTPEGQLAQDRITVADKAVTVAKNGYAPSLSLALRNQMLISSWNPYHVDRSRFKEGNFFGFEVGVGIPLFYGATKAKVKAAKRDREIAELELQQEQRNQQREYLTALSKCNSTFVRMKYYQEEGAEKDKELERLSGLEYENGEISYIEYMEALKDCTDFHMKKAAAINDYNQSVISLERLSGAAITK